MKEEYYSIIKDIIDSKEFKKLKNYKHHGINRYDHLLRVSYYTYKYTKKRKLNYIEATRGALLHDFFTDETNNLNMIRKLTEHPKYAVNNSKKYFKITKMEEDIIKTHMFPITLEIPKYKESFIVDIIDDITSIYERIISIFIIDN